MRILQIDEEDSLSLQTGNETTAAKCDLIATLLHTFLLRLHSHLKTKRLGSSGVVHMPGPSNIRSPPPLLQPIIDLLQYQGFCECVKTEVHRMVRALGIAGVPCGLRINFVGENGRDLVKLLNEDGTQKIGGEITLRVDDRYDFCDPIVLSHAQSWLTQAHTSSDIPIPFFLDRAPPSGDPHALHNSPTRPTVI
jgi:mediator of RNA polymerase II transcription subunit 17